MTKQGYKIYTRTGDKGMTSLGNGKRESKSSLRIVAIGEVDELNCILGLLITKSEQEDINEHLEFIQHALFNIGSDLAVTKNQFVTEGYVVQIESMIDSLEETLPPINKFILPGGNELAAISHLARAICRRAERCLIDLHNHEPVANELIMFVNRFSDLLFVIARTMNHRASFPETYWEQEAWQTP